MVTAQPNDRGDGPPVTFFTIANSAFFPGVVALLNSLRLVGHDEELVVLDDGFTPAQRDALREHCTLVAKPEEEVTNARLYKAFAHLLGPSGPVVVIDSDVVVTRSLRPIVEAAAGGQICVYPDPDSGRWFAEWEGLFALTDAPRHQPYICTHFTAFSTEHHPTLLGQWWDASQRVFSHPTVGEGVTAAGNPSAHADQDALNAVLMSAVDPDLITFLPPEERPHSPWLPRVEVHDLERLEFTFRGHPVTMLHADGSPKSWRREAWIRVRRDAYVRSLRRLFHGTDVALRWPANEPLPVWLRPGLGPDIVLRSLNRVNKVPRSTRRRIAEKVLPRSVVARVVRRVRPS